MRWGVLVLVVLVLWVPVAAATPKLPETDGQSPCIDPTSLTIRMQGCNSIDPQCLLHATECVDPGSPLSFIVSCVKRPAGC